MKFAFLKNHFPYQFPPPHHTRLMSSENTLLQAREEEGVKYERTFVASEFIEWLMQEGEAATRSEAEQLGRRLLEHGIIQHGEKSKQLHLLQRFLQLKSPGGALVFLIAACLGSELFWIAV